MQDTTVEGGAGTMVGATATAVGAPDTTLVAVADLDTILDTPDPRPLASSPSQPPGLTPAAGGHSRG